MAKRTSKGKKLLAWCWYSCMFNIRYCDREFEDEKVLILHQKAKHFKCLYCSRRLNSASGLVVHIAQIHKETIEEVPNSILGHDSPEIDIFGMQGVPPEDLQRHYDGLPIQQYKKSKLGEAGLVSLLAAQKAATSGNPLPMSAHVHLKQVQLIEGIGPSQAIPHMPKSIDDNQNTQTSTMYPMYSQQQSQPRTPEAQYTPIVNNVSAAQSTFVVSRGTSFAPFKIESYIDSKSGKRQPTSFILVSEADISPVLLFKCPFNY